MARYGMVIDTLKCVGCQDCVLACKTENNLPEHYDKCWIATETKGKFPNLNMEIRTERCNHCSEAPCVSACPTGASHVNEETGIVLVTANKCIGCKACIASCPYGARYVHPDGYVEKCTFCIHRLEEGYNTACAAVCPTSCIYFGDLEDPNSEINELLNSRKYHPLLPAAGTKPNIFYLV
jgi:Fe-S-cluster-containing dehydrogenase component